MSNKLNYKKYQIGCKFSNSFDIFTARDYIYI